MADEQKPEDEAPKERETSPRGSKLFHLYEEDLIVLEKALPEISDALMGRDNPRLRTHLRRIKAILSDIRWDYGPHGQVTIIPAEDIPPSGEPPADDGDPQGVP